MKENNFKQTEIGLIPEDWKVVRLGDVAEISAGASAPQGEKYFKNGKYPFIRVQHIHSEDHKVVGSDLITDEAIREYRLKVFPKDTIVFPKSGATIYLEKRAMLPFDAYIVSHLCAVLSKDSNALQKYLFYFLVWKKLAKKKESGYPTLNLSEIKNLLIPLPPLSEQQKIAKILDKIQQAIEIQDKIIEQTKNLKKSLMQKLFTEGLYGKEQKETEIGLIPKGWEVVRLGVIAEIKYGKAKPKLKGNIPVVGSGGIYDFTDRPLINTPTIVIGRKGTAGKCWLLMEPCYPSDTTFYLSWKGNIDSRFIYSWMQIKPLSGEHAKTTLPSLQKHDLETFKIPLPPLEEQKQIAHILSVVDRKIEVEQKKKEVLKDLFKTMLHKLMSGKIRLKDVEI